VNIKIDMVPVDEAEDEVVSSTVEDVLDVEVAEVVARTTTKRMNRT
jgi:hypothetical protein